VGEDAERWVTRVGCRRVLLVVHNVTSATRLLDVLPLFSSDVRVQTHEHVGRRQGRVRGGAGQVHEQDAVGKPLP
jgi:hypothetical protein